MKIERLAHNVWFVEYGDTAVAFCDVSYQEFIEDLSKMLLKLEIEKE